MVRFKKENKMNDKIFRKMGITLISVLCLSSSLGLAQTKPTLAGCKEADFVVGEEINRISIVGTSFVPKCLKIKAGATVTIEAGSHHPVSAMANVNEAINPFSNGNRFMEPQTRIMAAPGLFGHFCRVHGDAEGDGMAGAIWVEAVAPIEPPVIQE